MEEFLRIRFYLPFDERTRLEKPDRDIKKRQPGVRLSAVGSQAAARGMAVTIHHDVNYAPWPAARPVPSDAF